MILPRVLPALLALMLLSGCGVFGLGTDRLTSLAADYIEDRSAQELALLQAGEVIVCRRVPVGTAQRAYAASEVWPAWQEYCARLAALREPPARVLGRMLP